MPTLNQTPTVRYSGRARPGPGVTFYGSHGPRWAPAAFFPLDLPPDDSCTVGAVQRFARGNRSPSSHDFGAKVNMRRARRIAGPAPPTRQNGDSAASVSCGTGARATVGRRPIVLRSCWVALGPLVVVGAAPWQTPPPLGGPGNRGGIGSRQQGHWSCSTGGKPGWVFNQRGPIPSARDRIPAG